LLFFQAIPAWQPNGWANIIPISWPFYLNTFRNTPLFVYRPYDFTLELVGKLNGVGAKAEFITTNEGGHGITGKEFLPLYLYG